MEISISDNHKHIVLNSWQTLLASSVEMSGDGKILFCVLWLFECWLKSKRSLRRRRRRRSKRIRKWNLIAVKDIWLRSRLGLCAVSAICAINAASSLCESFSSTMYTLINRQMCRLFFVWEFSSFDGLHSKRKMPYLALCSLMVRMVPLSSVLWEPCGPRWT